MTGWAELLVVGALTVAPATGAVVPGFPAAAVDRPMPATTLLTFADPRIGESSGLVDTGRMLFTVNDSGDRARIFGVHPGTGATVGVLEYRGQAVDVEALAPGRGGALWVGDIGDNLRRRPTVSAYRVVPPTRPGLGGSSTVPAERVDLRYPDGPRDAEALLVQPGTERLFVVSKSPLGGTVYAAPRSLQPGRVNRLTPFATVGGLVTDGAFLPDGRHVVLRGYGTASVYRFPGFELVGTVRLPRQPQGEAIAVGPDGRVLLSSEGVHAEVLQVRLPERLLRAEPTARAPDAPAPASTGPAARRPAAEPAPTGATPWTGVGLVGAGAVGLAALLIRAARRRSPRSR